MIIVMLIVIILTWSGQQISLILFSTVIPSQMICVCEQGGGDEEKGGISYSLEYSA